jgi:chaperone required for assembly of F1-ATPase
MLAQNPNMTDEQLEQGLKMVAIFSTPTAMAIMGFIVNLIVSVILSLIIAIFAKREDRSIA